MFYSWQIFNRIDTAYEESDLLESWMSASIYVVDVMSALLIGFAISLLMSLSATNLLITLFETRNTMSTYTIGCKSLLESDLISHNALAASNMTISYDLCTCLIK